jgi:hypothetical protein
VAGRSPTKFECLLCNKGPGSDRAGHKPKVDSGLVGQVAARNLASLCLI